MNKRELLKANKTLEILRRGSLGQNMYMLANSRNLDQLGRVVTDIIGPDRDAGRISGQAYEALLRAGYWLEMMFITGEPPYPKPAGLAQFDPFVAGVSPFVPRPAKKK